MHTCTCTCGYSLFMQIHYPTPLESLLKTYLKSHGLAKMFALKFSVVFCGGAKYHKECAAFCFMHQTSRQFKYFEATFFTASILLLLLPLPSQCEQIIEKVSKMKKYTYYR